MSAINIPTDIASWRTWFFNGPIDTKLSRDDFETYWPFIDNVYFKQKSNKVGRPHQYTSTTWHCRLGQKDRPSQGQQMRKTTIQKSRGCGMRLAIEEYEDVVRVRRLPTCSQSHTHSLEDSDRHKRPSAWRKAVTTEVARGYKVSHVIENLQAKDRPEQRARVIEAGGQFMNRQDLVNWARAGPPTTTTTKRPSREKTGGPKPPVQNTAEA